MHVLIYTENVDSGVFWQKKLESQSIKACLLSGMDEVDARLDTAEHDAIIHIFCENVSHNFDALGQLRRGRTLPILVMTYGQTVCRVPEVLDAGADDILSTSVDVRELSARLKCKCRAACARKEKVKYEGGISIDIETHEVRWQGREIFPSSREFLILNELVYNPKRVFTKRYLETLLYGYGRAAESNTIEVFIHSLRKRTSFDAIITVRGMGYKLGNL